MSTPTNTATGTPDWDDIFGVTPGDGVDQAEVEAIQWTFRAFGPLFAGFAKANDTSETLAAMRQILEMMKLLVRNASADQIVAFVAAVQQARQTGQLNFSAIGGGSSNTPPAGQLGGGTPPPAGSVAQQIEALTQDPGQRAAIARILNPGDPDGIRVLPTGEPEETVRLRTQVTALTGERDRAQQDHTAARAERDSARQLLADVLRQLGVNRGAATDVATIVAAVQQQLGGVNRSLVQRELGEVERLLSAASASRLTRGSFSMPAADHAAALTHLTAAIQAVR